MSHSENAEPRVARPLARLRLIENGSHWLAVPPHADAGVDDGGHCSPPFVLPRLDRSLVQWCVVGAARIWTTRRRCTAMLLLLGCRTGRWTLRLPAQRCGADAACWTTAADRLPGLPVDACVAGTFQSRVLRDSEDAADAVPAMPGVHVVSGVTVHDDAGVASRLWVFVRAGGAPRLVDPDLVIADDWADAVEEAMPRLRLA